MSNFTLPVTAILGQTMTIDGHTYVYCEIIQGQPKWEYVGPVANEFIIAIE